MIVSGKLRYLASARSLEGSNMNQITVIMLFVLGIFMIVGGFYVSSSLPLANSDFDGLFNLVGFLGIIMVIVSIILSSRIRPKKKEGTA